MFGRGPGAGAEGARGRLSLLAAAVARLSASPDVELALRAVAAMTVPSFADWCAIDVLDEDGSIRRVAVAHADPAKEFLGWELARRYPFDRAAEVGIPYVIRTGRPELAPEIPAWGIKAVASDEEHLRLLRELGLRSCIVVPLRAGARVLGALSLVSAESARRYDDEALAFAEALAACCAVAADNARLVRRACEAERRAQESHVLLDTLFSEAPVGLAVCDRELRYQRVNAALAAMSGLAPEEHLGRPVAEVLPAIADRLVRPMRRVLETGESQMNEVVGETVAEPGRERRWIATYYPVLAGEEAVGVGAIVSEVAAGDAAHGRGGGDKEQFRALVEAAPNAIIGVDGQGRILLVNRQAEEMFGYERQELVGQRVELLVPDRFRAGHGRERADYRRDATVRPMGEGRDLRARRKDGSEFPVEISLGPAQTDEGLRVTAIIADITERKRAQEELERRAARQAALAALGERALEGADLDELMGRTVRLLAEHLGTELASVMEAMPGGQELVLRAAIGFRGVSVGSERVLAEGTLSGLALHTDGPVVVADLVADPRCQAGLLHQQGVVSGASVLIGTREHPLGVLGAHERAPRSFTPDELTFLQAVANVLGDAVRRRRSEEQIRHQALHDPLTGLGNRILLCERLTHWLQTARRKPGARAAVLFMDLNNFKVINDSLGHPAGDHLLREVGQRLAKTIRVGDTLARFGGDEFIVLCEDVCDEREAATVAERIQAAMEQPFTVEGRKVVVAASIGIAFATGATTSPDEPLRNADAAMYRAKERGSGRCELFDPGLHTRAVQRFDLEVALRTAVREDGFFVVYQPVMDVETGGMVGVEALVRWDHRRHGPLGPAEFIPVAEATGLIVPISLFVLEQACEQLARWNARRPPDSRMRVAVNLSAAHLVENDLSRRVEAALAAAGADPALLCLEITETALMRDPSATADALAALKRLGVRLAIDDFGTGYSSLAYLRRFPVDELKIDGSFVRGIPRENDDAAIVAAIVSMAHALELDVVAECVESAEQLAELHRLGADFAQGYHLGRPERAEVIDRLLSSAVPPGRNLPRPRPTSSSTALGTTRAPTEVNSPETSTT